MKKGWVVFVLLASLGGAFALQGGEQELIELDKKWGKASLAGDKAVLESIMADDLIAVGPQGVGSKAQVIEQTEPSEDTTYAADEYKVMMLGPDTAVMVHRVGGSDESHRSLHVWAKRDGEWKVVATATIPVESPSTNGN